MMFCKQIIIQISSLLLFILLFIPVNVQAWSNKVCVTEYYRIGISTDLIESESIPSVDAHALNFDEIDLAKTNFTFNLDLTCNITVPCPPLAAPSLIFPADGVIGVPYSPTFSWEEEPAAVSYDIQVSTDMLFGTTTASENVTEEEWTIPFQLFQNNTYYWRIRNVQTCGADPWSEVRSFTIVVPEYQCPIFESFFFGLPFDWTFNVTGSNAYWRFHPYELFSGVMNPGGGEWATYDDYLTGPTGDNNIATATSPTVDMSPFIDIDLRFDYAFVDDSDFSETVSLSITDGILTFYWDGNDWTDINTVWLNDGSVIDGDFDQLIPLDLDPSSLSITLEYNDGDAAARGGFGFDELLLCGNQEIFCSIDSANATNITCNDNGTLDVEDDFFTFDMNASGVYIASTYTISGDYNQSGLDYDIPIYMDNGGVGFLISNGDLNLTLTDDFDLSCDYATVVVAPDACSVENPCTNTLVLSGIESAIADNEAIWIESTQILLSGAVVDYDATDFIELEDGFMVEVGATFEAFIDGCDNGGGGSN